MNYKRNFIKREATKETYRGMAWTNNTDENTKITDGELIDVVGQTLIGDDYETLESFVD